MMMPRNQGSFLWSHAAGGENETISERIGRGEGKSKKGGMRLTGDRGLE